MEKLGSFLDLVVSNPSKLDKISLTKLIVRRSLRASKPRSTKLWCWRRSEMTRRVSPKLRGALRWVSPKLRRSLRWWGFVIRWLLKLHVEFQPSSIYDESVTLSIWLDKIERIHGLVLIRVFMSITRGWWDRLYLQSNELIKNKLALTLCTHWWKNQVDISKTVSLTTHLVFRSRFQVPDGW